MKRGTEETDGTHIHTHTQDEDVKRLEIEITGKSV